MCQTPYFALAKMSKRDPHPKKKTALLNKLTMLKIMFLILMGEEIGLQVRLKRLF